MEGGPPGFGRSFTCSALLGMPVGRVGTSAKGLSPAVARLSSRFACPLPCHAPVPQPREASFPVWAPAPSLAATDAISQLISLPLGTEMFHFPRCGSAGLSCSSRRRHPAKGAGLSHSDTSGSKPVDGSPELVAVFRVLHRLPMPRHPSCARIRLARNRFLARLVYELQFSLISKLPVFNELPAGGRTSA